MVLVLYLIAAQSGAGGVGTRRRASLGSRSAGAASCSSTATTSRRVSCVPGTSDAVDCFPRGYSRSVFRMSACTQKFQTCDFFPKRCLTNTLRRHHLAVGHRSSSYPPPPPSFSSFGAACVRLCCLPPSLVRNTRFCCLVHV